MTSLSNPTIPVSSPELYVAYTAWRDQDVEGGSWRALTKRFCGLCDWVDFHVLAENTAEEFDNQLETAFPDDTAYPFGVREYDLRSAEGTQHLNEARIKWVNDRIADYEKANQL